MTNNNIQRHWKEWHPDVKIADGYDSNDYDEDDAFPEEKDQGKQQGNERGAATQTATTSHGDTPVLDRFGNDITKAAEEGRLDPVVGREREIERLIQILSRRKKNNPVLIGEPGVGKSAIVEGLALRIKEHKVSRLLFDKRIVSLDMAGRNSADSLRNA